MTRAVDDDQFLFGGGTSLVQLHAHVAGHEIIIFTDRRNLVMAVNTADSPGSEVRMWYNPDEMENRQRAVFAIGCEVLDDELVCAVINAEE